MKRYLKKYASVLVISGAMLSVMAFAIENTIYQGFMARLGHLWYPWHEPFPKGPYTILLYSLVLLGIVIMLTGFIFADRGKEGGE